jgi:O-antigen/teichoic acid export membrane protein
MKRDDVQLAQAATHERRVGAMLAYVQTFLNMGIALAFTPVLVKSLGQSGYGLFSIVGSFAAYLAVMDMGMNDSVIRHLIHHKAKHDELGAREFLASMMSLYGLVGLAILAIGGLMIGLMPRIFAARMDQGELELLRSMLAVAAVATALTIALNPVGALVYSRERFVFLRTLEMVTHIVATVVMYVLLMSGMGALMVVAVSYGSLVAASGAKWLFATIVLKESPRYGRFSWQRVRPVVVYSAPIFVAMIVEQIYWKLDNILVGAFIGVAAVATYAIGVMFNKYFMSFATAISRVMIPEIIRRIDAGATAGELTSLLIRVARSQAIILMLVLTGLVIFGNEFIVLWLGPEYRISYVVMLLALCPYALDLMGNVRNTVLQTKNLYWHRVGIFAAMALLNIPVTIALMRPYGVAGAAASTGICIMVGHFLILQLLQRKVGIRTGAYYKGLSSGIAPAVLACFLLGWGLQSVLPGGWMALVGKVTAYTLTYSLVLWHFGLNDRERAAAGALLQKLTGGRRVA